MMMLHEIENEVVGKALKKAMGEKLLRKEIENGMLGNEAVKKNGIL